MLKNMNIVNGYFDYCISEQCITTEDFNQTKKLLLELGYRTIAVNQIFNETNLEPKRKKKKGEPRIIEDIIPAPIDVSIYQDNSDLNILSRLTIVFSNQDVFTKIVKSPNYKKYNIIAVTPLTQNAFQFTCSNIDADILSYDPENKISYKLNRKMYNQLVEKDYHYELLYSPAIRDSSQRKHMIHISHVYHSFGKSKNIIISSGATNRMFLRGPYDVINLGLIYGLSEEQAKNSVLHNGRNVYLNAVGRMNGKSIMFTTNANNNTSINYDISKASNDEDKVTNLQQPVLKKQKQ